MSRYPVEKYKMVVHQHPDYHTTEIIAMSTYAGQVVKGKALCHINDEYSEDKEIHHIDLNRQNNHWDNLLPLTKQQHLELHRQLNEKENNKQVNKT